MAFPSTQATKTELDQGTDSPVDARAELAALVDLVNLIITSHGQALGICDLDDGGKIPAARLPGGAGTGTDADLLDGQHGSFYQNIANMTAGTLPAARFADSSHGNRAGGALHTAATQVLAGFMSATDKQKIDGMAASIAAAFTTSTVNAQIAGTAVYAVGSYVFAALESWANSPVNPGGTISGSLIRPVSATVGSTEFQTYGTGMSGTWRCMGYARMDSDFATGNATLWLRIA